MNKLIIRIVIRYSHEHNGFQAIATDLGIAGFGLSEKEAIDDLDSGLDEEDLIFYESYGYHSWWYDAEREIVHAES